MKRGNPFRVVRGKDSSSARHGGDRRAPEFNRLAALKVAVRQAPVVRAVAILRNFAVEGGSTRPPHPLFPQEKRMQGTLRRGLPLAALLCLAAPAAAMPNRPATTRPPRWWAR